MTGRRLSVSHWVLDDKDVDAGLGPSRYLFRFGLAQRSYDRMLLLQDLNIVKDSDVPVRVGQVYP